MGKDLLNNHSEMQLEDYSHLSCMPWDIRHFFDHHHWHNVKKLLPYRKHGGSKHARYDIIAKSSLKDRGIEEVLKFLGAEYDRTVEQTTSKVISSNKKSGMGRIRALIAKEMFKDEHRNEKHKGLHFPLGSKLQRTLSIHHFEPSDDWLAKKPIISILDVADSSVVKSHDASHSSTPANLLTCAEGSETLDGQEMKNDVVIEHHSDDYVGVLEVFKVNKKLFQEIARDPVDRKLDCSSSLRHAKSRSRLTKLNSFPLAANSSPSRKFLHGLDQKNETQTRSCLRVESLVNGTRSPKLLVSKSSVADTKAGSGVVKLERCSSSPSSTHVLNNERIFRRVSSLNNSMDRYSQLIEHRFNRDNKFRQSKSSKLACEGEFISSGHDSNLESLSTIGNDANQDLSYDNDEPELVGIPMTTGKCLPVSAAVVETRCSESYLIEQTDSCSTINYASEMMTGINDEGSHGLDEQRKYTVELSMDEDIPNPEEHTDVICLVESQTSGGPDLKSSCIHNTSENNQHEKIDENTKESFENYFRSSEPRVKTKTNFNYISDVLKKSGISLKQASSSSPSDELCGYELVDNWDHQLLYDLVTQVLLDINEKSYAYWPRLLSQICRIHPMPTEQHFLQEVGKTISNYSNLRSDQDPSLDFVVTQDLGKDDSWMNLQYDTEIVALEIEDIIFDDLFDEIFLC